MQTHLSAKYRLVTLLLASIIPGTHRIYVGKIKSGLCMLLVQLFLLFSIKPILNFLGPVIENFLTTAASNKISATYLITQNIISISILLSILLICLIFMIFVLIDLSAISIGSFKDVHQLPLLRRKHCEISTKSNITAILLCTLLGFLGIHRFYLGRKITGSIILFSFLLILFTIATHQPDNFLKISAAIHFYISKIAIMYFVVCFVWVYFIDTLALLAGILTDADGKLLKDFSS